VIIPPKLAGKDSLYLIATPHFIDLVAKGLSEGRATITIA